MQIIGIILIILVIVLLVAYFKWTSREVVAEKGEKGMQKVTIIVEGNYNPGVIKAKKNQPLTIVFDRREDSACSKKVLFPDFKIVQELTDFGKTELTFTPDKAGEFGFSCEMGMYQGKLIIEE